MASQGPRFLSVLRRIRYSLTLIIWVNSTILFAALCGRQPRLTGWKTAICMLAVSVVDAVSSVGCNSRISATIFPDAIWSLISIVEITLGSVGLSNAHIYRSQFTGSYEFSLVTFSIYILCGIVHLINVCSNNIILRPPRLRDVCLPVISRSKTSGNNDTQVDAVHADAGDAGPLSRLAKVHESRLKLPEPQTSISVSTGAQKPESSAKRKTEATREPLVRGPQWAPVVYYWANPTDPVLAHSRHWLVKSCVVLFVSLECVAAVGAYGFAQRRSDLAKSEKLPTRVVRGQPFAQQLRGREANRSSGTQASRRLAIPVAHLQSKECTGYGHGAGCSNCWSRAGSADANGNGDGFTDPATKGGWGFTGTGKRD
ncbi:hypothetical protein QBC42DRAFT_299193 [Cladorrhinum samala]|uniref:Uncharacterized protein n=1 Tax=Cladorrhinum samala TaxID=585594 RepID=A0AAV9HIM8_9PEZI|nr:hypothetical protein QBC42DRAFT_299193 [Cladorrhinum samala]